jgi:hypothetical protein
VTENQSRPGRILRFTTLVTEWKAIVQQLYRLNPLAVIGGEPLVIDR